MVLAAMHAAVGEQGTQALKHFMDAAVQGLDVYSHCPDLAPIQAPLPAENIADAMNGYFPDTQLLLLQTCCAHAICSLSRNNQSPVIVAKRNVVHGRSRLFVLQRT